MAVNRKSPVGFVTVLRLPIIAGLLIVTVTPGRTALDVSVTGLPSLGRHAEHGVILKESSRPAGRSRCLADGGRQVRSDVSGVRERGTYLAGGEGVLLGDGIDRFTGGQWSDNRGDVDARAGDARLPESDVRVHRDAGKDFHAHRASLRL